MLLTLHDDDDDGQWIQQPALERSQMARRIARLIPLFSALAKSLLYWPPSLLPTHCLQSSFVQWLELLLWPNWAKSSDKTRTVGRMLAPSTPKERERKFGALRRAEVRIKWIGNIEVARANAKLDHGTRRQLILPMGRRWMSAHWTVGRTNGAQVQQLQTWTTYVTIHIFVCF